MSETTQAIPSSGSIQGRRILYLAFATATLLVLGLIYAWSIFAAPIGRAFPEYGPVLSQVFQVSMFMFCVSALFGAQIYKRVSPRATILLAAVLLAAGFVLTAFCAGFGVWALFLCYGIIAASGCGIAYNAIISIVGPWFPDKTGLCSGVMMMGFGISSLVFGSLANAAFGVIDWPIVFVAIAVVGFVLMLVLAAVVKPAPADIATRLGLAGTAVSTKESATKSESILKTRVFWFFCIWSTFIIACSLTLIGSAAQGMNAVDPAFAAFGPVMVGLVSTMNGFSRIINGAIFDRFGLVPVMVLSATVGIACMSGLALSFALGTGGFSPLLYIGAGILVALPYGSVPVMSAAFARQRYRASDFSKNFGIVNLSIAAAAALNLVIGAILGSVHLGAGVSIYTILAVLAVCALLSVLAFSRIYAKDLATIEKELR